MAGGYRNSMSTSGKGNLKRYQSLTEGLTKIHVHVCVDGYVVMY